ncbi:CTD nuclear envelope phosphatase 1, partial [Chytridiales sp. JEL 0842]
MYDDDDFFTWLFRFLISLLSRILPQSLITSTSSSTPARSSKRDIRKSRHRRLKDKKAAGTSTSEFDLSEDTTTTGGETTDGGGTGTDTPGPSNGVDSLTHRSRRSTRLSVSRTSKYTVTIGKDHVPSSAWAEKEHLEIESSFSSDNLDKKRLTTPPKRQRTHSNLLLNPSSFSAPRKLKTLVLDLDETLIHSTTLGSKHHDHMIEVLVDKHVCLYYVYKRPYADLFLKK